MTTQSPMDRVRLLHQATSKTSGRSGADVPDDWADSVVVERRGPTLWVTLNRPDTLNGLTPDILFGLASALDVAETDAECRSVVVTGTGGGFCAGGDLAFQKDLLSSEIGRTEGWSTWLNIALSIMRRLRELPVPVLAAVQGAAVAGGLELIVNCDLVVAAESARIGDGHANYGFVSGVGCASILPRLVGVARASHLMLTGELMTARQLESWGLISTVVEDELLIPEVTRLTDLIAQKSPTSLRRMKRLIRDADDAPLAIAIAREQDQLLLQAWSPDLHEGLAAFEERRAPRFETPRG
jgi:enoyl-CoA hydratase